MQSHDHVTQQATPPTVTETSHRSRWVFGGFALLAVLLLAFEHSMHLSGLIGWLPYLILLVCPLMHLFMHGGHGHGGGDGRSNDGAEK